METTLKSEALSLIKEIDVAIRNHVNYTPNRYFQKERIEFDLHRILNRTHELILNGSLDDEFAETTYELASILFCKGIDSQIFRRALAIVARRYQENKKAEFLPLSILSGLPTLPDDELWLRKAIGSNRFQFAALLSIAYGKNLMNLKAMPTDNWELRLGEGALAILKGDFDLAKDCIISACRFWMEDDDEWRDYEPGYYPQFEPYLCAFASKLVALGGVSRNFPSDVRHFLGFALLPD